MSQIGALIGSYIARLEAEGTATARLAAAADPRSWRPLRRWPDRPQDRPRRVLPLAASAAPSPVPGQPGRQEPGARRGGGGGGSRSTSRPCSPGAGGSRQGEMAVLVGLVSKPALNGRVVEIGRRVTGGKKAHIAAKMFIQPGQRVLDIGCGWGGFALYLARHYDIEVTGVALAPDQISFCKERAEAAGLADRVTFELMDYRDVQGQFDRISSVGLLEHVGTPHYPEFFEHTNRLLAPDGVMVSHCCGRAGAPGFTDKWTRKYIFPGGYIPALSELVTQSEKYRWQVMDVEAMRFHYSHTLEEWYRRTVLHRKEIEALYDERFYRMWLFYLAGAEQSFRHGNMVNWQLQYVKDRNAIPMTREYIETESARLRAADAGNVPKWHLDPVLDEAAE